MLTPWIGNGKEGRTDLEGKFTDELVFEKALLENVKLAQPDALFVCNSKVLIVCSESSSIAQLDYQSYTFATITGGGDQPDNLFRYYFLHIMFVDDKLIFLLIITLCWLL